MGQAVTPTAELWCHEPNNAAGDPHRFLLAKVFYRAGRLDLVVTPGVMWSINHTGADDSLSIDCPKHQGLPSVPVARLDQRLHHQRKPINIQLSSL